MRAGYCAHDTQVATEHDCGNDTEGSQGSMSKRFTTMTNQGPRMMSGGRSFRHCVQDCARDDRMVKAYNELYGTQLKAPLLALLRHEQGEPGPDPDTEEGAELGRFILFCYGAVWRRVKRVHQGVHQFETWPLGVMGGHRESTSVSCSTSLNACLTAELQPADDTKS